MKFLWYPNEENNGRQYTAESIVESSAPVLHKGFPYCGVYILILDKEIVYVGQSKDVRKRIDQHTSGHGVRDIKNFNRYFVVLCEPEKLDSLEAYYILQFRPKYNIAIPREEQ